MGYPSNDRQAYSRSLTILKKQIKLGRLSPINGEEVGRSVILFYKELLSGCARCPFAGFFIGDLYRFSIELEAPAKGCGFIRPFK
jgi:hypothetical protein